MRELFERHHLPRAPFAGSEPIAAVLPQDRDAWLAFYCSGLR